MNGDIPKRGDLEDNATKGDVVDLKNKIEEWKEAVEDDIESVEERTLERERIENLMSRRIKEHERECDISTIYDLRYGGDNPSNSQKIDELFREKPKWLVVVVSLIVAIGQAVGHIL